MDVRRVEFRRIDERSQDRWNVARAFTKRFGCFVDKRGRRIVGDKSSRQFQRNKAGRRRVLSQEIDDAKTVFHSSSRWDAIAKHDLLGGIMDPRLKIETAVTPRLANCPAGPGTGYLLDGPL